MPAFSQLDRKYRYMQKQENLDYSKGYTTYLANDVVPENQLVYATDTRISTLGRMKTRQGCDFYSVPAGEAQDQAQTSATGAADKAISPTTWLAAKFTAGATGRLTRLDLELKNAASATGPIIVELHADSSGSPAIAALGQSSVPSATPTNAYAYLSARFIEAPQVTSGTVYWVVAYIQSDGTNTYSWNSTTSATSAKTSSNSGGTWSATSYDLHYKTFVSTNSPTLGLFRAYKSDGTKSSLMAHGTNVYTINDNTGALTSIKNALSGSATRYRFATVNDIVYYVNGLDAPRKWDFTTESATPGSPVTSSDLILYKNQMFYLDSANPTRLFWSDIGSFESFTSTNFLYVPAPKSPDPITGMAILNDNLYIWTRSTKWVLTGSDITNFILRKATGNKGTVAPDSLVVTRNYAYFASDDGFYQFNGSTDKLLSEAITGDYLSATGETTWAGEVWNNRYYLFYTPSGQAQNSQCWIYNLNYDSIESNDLATYIGHTETWDGKGDTGQFLQASDLVGAVYYAELSGNSYNNLGKALSWEIRTKYDHYGQPGTNKHVKRWYPRFSAVSGNYTVFVQYDKDFAGAPTTQFVYLRGTGSLWNSGVTWSSFSWGNSALVNPRVTVPGLARYIQMRYLRPGVNLPVEFLGSTCYYFIRRPR